MDGLRHFSITAIFGDDKSIVTHPASTTPARLSAEERAAIGLSDGVVRLSIVLEDVEDLIEDLDMAGRGSN